MLDFFLIRSSFAGWTGLEPATSCVTGRHSNQLNYHSKIFNNNLTTCSSILSGMDGTRTRDLLRDRQAF